MRKIKPIKLSSNKTNTTEKLTSAEMWKLWASYMGNSMSACILKYYLQHVEDKDIKALVENALKLSEEFLKTIKLHDENLPSPSFLDDLVTTSTFAPFSDKLMLFHKMDMFSIKIRSFGNSTAVNGRHDLGMIYTKALLKNSAFVEDAAKMMLEKGWFEKPPSTSDREKLASN